MNKDNSINNARTKIIAIEWYVPQYTPSNPQQGILLEQILSKTPTELQYLQRSVFMKEVNTQNLWTFQLGKQERRNNRNWIFDGFDQRDGQGSQYFSNDTFHRPPVTSTQTLIGTEKYPTLIVVFF